MLTLEEPPTLVCPQLSASPVLLTGTPPDLTVELPFAVLTFVCVFTPSTGRWSCTEEPSVDNSNSFTKTLLSVTPAIAAPRLFKSVFLWAGYPITSSSF